MIESYNLREWITHLECVSSKYIILDTHALKSAYRAFTLDTLGLI